MIYTYYIFNKRALYLKAFFIYFSIILNFAKYSNISAYTIYSNKDFTTFISNILNLRKLKVLTLIILSLRIVYSILLLVNERLIVEK